MISPEHAFSVIDVHVHVHPHAAETFLEIMDANNLSRVVNLGTLERLGFPFEQGMRAYQRVFGERLVYFTTPDFDDTSPGFGDRMAHELERKTNGGARGLKIFKELGLRCKDTDGALVTLDDVRLDPLWAKAGELGVPVLIHTADPVAFFQPLNEDNERWEELQAHPDWHFGAPEFLDHNTLLEQRNRVIDRHPATTFIGAHLGNYPEDLTYVGDCLDRYANLYVDTSARIGEIGRHPAEEARAFFLKHQDRVLFGTDLVVGWPVVDDQPLDELTEYKQYYAGHWRYFETTARQIKYPGYPIQGRWKVDGIGLPKDVLEKLYSQNAQRLIAFEPHRPLASH
jgi:predicted TIM-barrel fold metal-dependent hydrolase